MGRWGGGDSVAVRGLLFLFAFRGLGMGDEGWLGFGG